MSIDQTDTVDFISINKAADEVFLTITDHLQWNSNEHLWLLQEKINAYLRFVESGEIFKTYPDAKNRKIVIDVRCKYRPDQSALNFLQRVIVVVEAAGFNIKYQHLPS